MAIRSAAPTRSTPVRARPGVDLEASVGRLFDSIARRPIRAAGFAVALSIFVGGSVFSVAEKDVGIVDGWWWAFVSMSTVGYGDIAPQTTGVRMLATFVIATGIMATAILTAALAGRVARVQMQRPDDTVELDDDIDEMMDTLQHFKKMVCHPAVEAALHQADREMRGEETR